MTRLYEEAARDGTAILVLVVLLSMLLARRLGAEERRKLLLAVYLTMLHLVLLPVVVLIAPEPSLRNEVRLVALLSAAMALIGCAGTILFSRVLPFLGLRVTGILRDLVIAGSSIVAAFVIARRLEFSLHGIIATSAVVTAIVGFSLQDVLGNVMGGLSIQLDSSFSSGDWIKVGDVSGRVVEVRWRHTAVETRNGDTLLLPNSLLTKGQVIVMARSAAQHGRTRRWVWFNVDFRFQPTDVVAAVEQALRNVPIRGVCAESPISCVLMELSDSYGRYAVRYWLKDLVNDDSTDSEVRTRVFFALSRAGMPLSIPAHAIFVTEDSTNRRERKGAEERERRRRVLGLIDLFAHVADADKDDLAVQMRPAPFARGEVIHRQGAEAHWLYVLVEGEVEERVSKDGLDEVVCRLSAPNIFGETSLMTGSPRVATVVALTDVECYRLDKEAFTRVMQTPEVAEHMAQVMARRRVQIDHAQEELDAEAGRRRLQATERDILDRIRGFFGVDKPD